MLGECRRVILRCEADRRGMTLVYTGQGHVRGNSHYIGLSDTTYGNDVKKTERLVAVNEILGLRL